MYETLEHWKQYKQKKYQQCPAEKPGAMVLDEMIEAEEQEKKFNTNFMLVNKISNDNSSKLVSEYAQKEFDEWMKDLRAKNGTTNY